MTDAELATAIEALERRGYTVIEGEFVPVAMYPHRVIVYAPREECMLVEKAS